MIVIDATSVSKMYRLNQPVVRRVRDLIPLLVDRLSRNSHWRRSREHQDFWALKDINFQQEDGEVLGLYGRNGAGKSTLLKILSRVTEPTLGQIKVRGRVGSLLEVGIGFHQELSGRDNIYLSGAILGMKRSEIKKRFDEIVHFAEIERYVDEPVKRYSSGMYVRLAFAVAAHLEQEILLIDEVLAVGDVLFQKSCIDKLRSFAKSGRTVLFVSHNVMSMRELCDKALYLKNGEIVAQGGADDVCVRYLQDVSMVSATDLERTRNRSSFVHAIKDEPQTKFDEIDLESSLGATIAFGEPLVYKLAISSANDIENVQVGFSIYDQADACVGTSHYRSPFSVAAGQTLRLRLTTRNLGLAPGIYSVRFALDGGNLQSRSNEIDRVFLKPGFEIIDNATLEPMLWQKEKGYFAFEQVTVEMLENDQAG
ncbi:MAG: ATP-binding cassette domain-containing protein [Candidatus Obscuribacterales bacterium]|nr:ATP-binding cassette domain-containing protein [Candidatus Obscuribacterales bacterium]